MYIYIYFYLWIYKIVVLLVSCCHSRNDHHQAVFSLNKVLVYGGIRKSYDRGVLIGYSSDIRHLCAARGMGHESSMEDIWSARGRNIAAVYVDMLATSRPRPVTLHDLSSSV